MEIMLKESKTGWVKVSDSISVLVGYPTIEQDEELKKILYEVGFITNDQNVDDLTPKDKSDLMSLNEKYYKLYLKYTIKDWKGVNFSGGDEAVFKLTKNEMDDGLWQKLCRALVLSDIYELVKLIKKEIDFNDSDKKK